MRANTVHAVFTPEPTICHGGHFYSTATMQESACSWVHAFVADYRITNTNHPPASKLLRRIALFYHLGLVQHKISGTISDLVCLFHD